VIVVDLGCATQGGDESIGPLIDRYDPDLFLGFDPWPDLVETAEFDDGTMVVLKRIAAWTYTGRVPYTRDGLRSRTIDVPDRTMVRCFDLAVFLQALPADELIVKFDVEGAEVPLLEHLYARGVDSRISTALVEWHDTKPYWPDDFTDRRNRLLKALRCPVEEWGSGT